MNDSSLSPQSDGTWIKKKATTFPLLEELATSTDPAGIFSHELQGDVLKMEYGRDYKAGRFQFRQNKTKEHMSFRATERLKDRLADIEIGMIVPGSDGKKYDKGYFIKQFTRVRKSAGLDHCKFQTLRHTAITRLARAGCTGGDQANIEISGLTEHFADIIAEALAGQPSGRQHFCP